MTELLSRPTFWLAISILAYSVGQWCARKTNSPLCNPLLIAALLVGTLMTLTDTTVATYNGGGTYISFFLTPATVALAVPIFRKLDVLRRNLLPILIGSLVGSLVSICSVLGLCQLFGLSDSITRSLVPKSVTTPIATALSDTTGGIVAVTALAVAITGIFGAMALPIFLKCVGVRNPVQMGLSIGTASHAVGTSRAIELGETEGAISGLAIGVAGLLTALLVTLGYLILG